MQVWANRYSIVAGAGFVIYAYALGHGAASGQVVSADAWPLSLRYLGGGLFIAGLALGLARRRIEGKRPGLNAMFGLLVGFSALLLVAGTVVSVATGEAFLLVMQAGLAAAVAALVVGLLAMVIAPPEATPSYDYPWMNPEFDPNKDAYAAGMVVPTQGYATDDLTRIAGLDAQAADLLHAAGVRYFSQLANLSPLELADILVPGGMAEPDPTSWPDQALLAANGDWRALERLQAQLGAAQAA